MKRILSAFLLVLLLSGAAFGKKDRVIKILAIGNSFSEDAVENYLWDIAAADGKSFIVGNLYIGGCSLERHLDNVLENKAEYRYRKTLTDGDRVQEDGVSVEKALADEEWDYISFQQSSPLSGLYDTWEASLPGLAAYVRARVPKRTKFMIHQTWAYESTSTHEGFKNYDNDQMKMYTAIVDAVTKAARLQKIKVVVPVGSAIQNLRSSFLGDHVTRDGYHLDKSVGRYTAACTWYETLTGCNVIGNPYCPEDLSAERRNIAQRAAHEAVRNPRSITDLSGMPENVGETSGPDVAISHCLE